MTNLPDITFKDFRILAERRGHTQAELAARFRGLVDEPTALMARIWDRDNEAVVLPYRSMLLFYQQEREFYTDTHRDVKRCACGCGLPVWEARKKWAGPGCRKRAQRSVSVTVKSAPAK